MFIRFLKVILFIPFALFILGYWVFSPLWYIFWNKSADDVDNCIYKYINKYDRWN